MYQLLDNEDKNSFYCIPIWGGSLVDVDLTSFFDSNGIRGTNKNDIKDYILVYLNNIKSVISLSSAFYPGEYIYEGIIDNGVFPKVLTFNTSKVASFSSAFNHLPIVSLDLSNWNTSNATSMKSMFNHCNFLTTLDISNFDTSNVTDMESMFENCFNLTTIKGIIDMKSCTNYNRMFYQCDKLTGVQIKNPPSGFSENVSGLNSNQYTIVS